MSTLKLINHKTVAVLLFCVISKIILQLLPSADIGLETKGNRFRLTISTFQSNILTRVMVFPVLASPVYLFFEMTENFSNAKEP